MVDFERTLTDRVYSNLKFGFEHLPKRILARSKSNLFSHPVYVSPGINPDYEIKDSLPSGVNCEFVRREGKVYGATSGKTSGGSTTASFGSASFEDHPDMTYDREAAKQLKKQHGDCSDCDHHEIDDRSYLEKLNVPPSPFDAGIREKLFIALILLIVLVYIFLRFLS